MDITGVGRQASILLTNTPAFYSAYCRRVHGYLESDINSEPTWG